MLTAATRSSGAEPQPFPWEAALLFGLGRLRLTPDAFWTLSLHELMALSGGTRRVTAPDRAELLMLMRRWPDEAGAQPRS